MKQRNVQSACPVCGASLSHTTPMSREYHENVKRRSQENEQQASVYREEDRARLRAGLSNEQHLYVTTLETIANAAYHVWKNTPHASMPHAMTRACLNDLYDALAKVDFMEDDELRDQ